MKRQETTPKAKAVLRERVYVPVEFVTDEMYQDWTYLVPDPEPEDPEDKIEVQLWREHNGGRVISFARGDMGKVKKFQDDEANNSAEDCKEVLREIRKVGDEKSRDPARSRLFCNQCATENPLIFLDHRIVESEEIVRFVASAHLYGRARMRIQLSRYHVRQPVTPFHFVGQRLKMLSDALDDRTDMKLRIFQETEQEFERTVAGASTDSVDCCVQPVRADDARRDGVRIGQLLIVVSVNAQLDSGPFEGTQIQLGHIAYLLGIKRTVAIDEI